MKDLSAAGGHICGAQGMLKCICMMVNYVCKALTIVGTVWGRGRVLCPSSEGPRAAQVGLQEL